MEGGEVRAVLADKAVLAQYMTYRGETVRSLAAKTLISGGRRRKPVHPSLIGHLRSGKRRTCGVETAAAIERALDVPSGVLFRVQVRYRAA